MSKIIGICVIFVLIAFSTQSDECEKGLTNAVECLDKKVSLAKVEIDKKNEVLNKQKSTIEKLKKEAKNPKPKCTEGWAQFEGSCYKYFSDFANWDAAQSICVKNEGNLATIRNQAENNFIRNLTIGSVIMWFGLKGMSGENRNGPYSWVDGSPCCSYTNWSPESEKSNSDCNRLNRATGQWNDGHCYYSSPFICKQNKGDDNEGDQNDSAHTNPMGNWRQECALSDEEKWKSSGSSSTTSAPGETGHTIAPGLSTLPPQTCDLFCPTRSGSTTPPNEEVEGFLTDKIDTIKKVLGLLGPIFGSSGQPTGPLDGLLSGLLKLLDNILKAVLSALKGDLGPLQSLVNGLDLLLAKLPKVEAPVDTSAIPKTPTRVKRQGITLLGLEGLIKNVLMLVRQLLNDLLPALQKLLKDIGPDLLNLLDKLLGSLRELLDKVLTGLILALGGNSNFLSALSGGLSLLGMLG